MMQHQCCDPLEQDEASLGHSLMPQWLLYKKPNTSALLLRTEKAALP